MQKAKELGKYIVADLRICHGKPTFRGTRILVKDVLEMLAEGMHWEAIVQNCGGKIGKEAIAEAILVASAALTNHESRAAPEPALASR